MSKVQDKNAGFQRPLIFGEVLFDCFPDGRKILGGAPFNVAWHLQGLGLRPLLCTSVGADFMGQQVKQEMRDWGMDLSGVQTNSRFPTGMVSVRFDNGQPAYDILADQAYDYLDVDFSTQHLASEPASLIYHGSLALRSPQGQKVFERLASTLGSPIFLDLNLREPWWQRKQIEDFMRRARWVKLNDQELFEIHGTSQTGMDGIKSAAQEVFEKYQLQWLIVTLGEQGAFVVTRDGITEGKAVKAKPLVDTVGAGDAFSAVTIAGILAGWPIGIILDKALAFAAAICGQRGATSKNPALYQ